MSRCSRGEAEVEVTVVEEVVEEEEVVVARLEAVRTTAARVRLSGRPEFTCGSETPCRRC
jgi:hypothetical protein